MANALSIFLIILRTYVGPTTKESASYTWRGHDFPEFLPLNVAEPELVHMRVEESRHYTSLANHSDAIWFSLTSAGWGYTHLGPENRIFMVTMFHELHCLRFLSLAMEGDISTGHIHHCLNYLRQTTLCSCDLTLEPGDFTKRNFEADRVGALHTCRDWSAAYDVMQERWDYWKANKAL
ncbi:hypothetical protein H0H93_000550 [Arthromyces matolae]|nr:hypothetical protein H0H93_000550 [Arthromyces matolae]